MLLAIIPVCFVVGIAASVLYNWYQPDGPMARNSHQIVPWLYFIKFNPLSRVWEFLLGMACGMTFLRAERRPGLGWPLIAAGIAMASVAGTLLHRNTSLVLHPAVVAPAFAAIVYGVALRPAGIAVMENKFFVLLGEVSYSFYLLHTQVIGGFEKYFQDAAGNLRHQNALGLLLVLGTTALISIGVYRGIERPMRRILRPKRAEQKSPPVPLASVAETG